MTGVRTLYSSDTPVSDSCQSTRAGLRCDMSDMLLLLHRHVIINTEHSHLRQSSCLYFVQFVNLYYIFSGEEVELDMREDSRDLLGFPQLGKFVERSLRRHHVEKEDAVEVVKSF